MPESFRPIALFVHADGSITPVFDGEPGFTYQSWRHFFACGISCFADDDWIFVRTI